MQGELLRWLSSGETPDTLPAAAVAAGATVAVALITVFGTRSRGSHRHDSDYDELEAKHARLREFCLRNGLDPDEAEEEVDDDAP